MGYRHYGEPANLAIPMRTSIVFVSCGITIGDASVCPSARHNRLSVSYEGDIQRGSWFKPWARPRNKSGLENCDTYTPQELKATSAKPTP